MIVRDKFINVTLVKARLIGLPRRLKASKTILRLFNKTDDAKYLPDFIDTGAGEPSGISYVLLWDDTDEVLFDDNSSIKIS